MSENISKLRFPLAVLVVLIHHNIAWHLPENWHCGLYDSVTIILSQGICLMAVPTFFFISGYLFFNKLEEWNWNEWKRKMKGRFNTLLMPYIIWNIVAFVLIALLAIKSISPSAYLDYFNDQGGLRIFWDMPGGDSPIDFPLWFIRDLIVCVILSPLLWFVAKKAGYIILPIIIIMYITAVFPFENDLSGSAIPLFLLGGTIKLKNINVPNNRVAKYSISIIYLILLLVLYFCYGIHSEIQEPIARCLKVVSVPMAFILISMVKSKSVSDKLIKLGECSFFIYAAHTVLIRDFSFIIVHKILPITNTYIATIDYFLSFAITLTATIGIYYGLKQFAPAILNILNGKFKYIR